MSPAAHAGSDQADVDGEKMIGPNVHSILSVRGYDILNMQEYLNTFNDVSAAPERLMRRIIQTVATNALKTVYPVDILGESSGPCTVRAHLQLAR